IPEAAALVIQAGAMAEGGDVFVLDMGEPVRIVDLARKMIRLMGFTVRDEQNPNGDIEIQFTGLRPGEKLYEELLLGENVTVTSHSKISRAEEAMLTWPRIKTYLDQIVAAKRQMDRLTLYSLLVSTGQGYKKSTHLPDAVWQR